MILKVNSKNIFFKVIDVFFLLYHVAGKKMCKEHDLEMPHDQGLRYLNEDKFIRKT